VLLLHGFPELAFSWRKLMPLIAARGYHVIAPDQRGYGATTGWDADYDGDLDTFRLSHLVRDILTAALSAGVSTRRRRRRSRFRFAGGRVVRPAASGHLRKRGALERTVPRTAAPGA
jgi:alpha-beta hydrolase superfamily lysophospholipase